MESKALGQVNLRDFEETAVRLVRQAGLRALELFQRPLPVEFKKGDRAEPVTQADREIEAFLRSSIAREFPGHGILGEEGTEVEVASHDFLWVLDPVDGTTNFSNGLPLFACSAGLLRRGEPVVGALFLSVAPRPIGRPATTGGEGGHEGAFPQPVGAVLHARLHGGAFLEGEAVRASEALAPEPSSLAGLPGHHARQFGRHAELRDNPGEIRCLGSVCLETALVACGALRYALFRRPRLWDLAAGALIVREAGGQALAWRSGRWEPLTRFEAMENPAKRGESGLRFWTSTTLVGGSQVARFVADRLRPTMPLRTRIERLFDGLVLRRRS